ncbi:MAG: Xaa-Pro peptidase family protein [Ginsengibacter sp.]
MKVKRREFINLSALAAGGVITGMGACTSTNKVNAQKSSAKDLHSMIGDLAPITVNERKSRIEKAQQLMNEQNMGALIMESGTSLTYFTGVRWWPSERTMVAIIPAKGQPIYVCPGFEETRFKELITIGEDVYVWQEDESPYRQIVKALQDAGIRSGNIGMEEQLRFFIFDGVRQEAPQFNYVSGTPITMACRIIKSPTELALMQKANDITVAGMKYGISQLHENMTQGDLSAIISDAQEKMGGRNADALVLFGESSAFPHGSVHAKPLKKGDIVLMDCGCEVYGYTSDITRTIVFGAEPTQRQLNIWNLEQKSQIAGFAAAKNGVACEQVDAAARKVITDADFGPGYKLPGLPHRTGHGIGMDGHEWGNMVKGNKQLIEPGMCFSVEPTISIPGEFGIRLEDCVYITTEGPKWFSPVAKSISEPFS